MTTGIGAPSEKDIMEGSTVQFTPGPSARCITTDFAPELVERVSAAIWDEWRSPESGKKLGPHWSDATEWQRAQTCRVAIVALEASGVAELIEALTVLPETMYDAGRALRRRDDRLDLAVGLEVQAGFIRKTLAKFGGRA